jgi:hypothetical protein
LTPVIVGLLAFTADTPAPDEALLTRAEAAFRAGIAARSQSEEARRHFAEAADAYQSLYESGAHNADLCRDLGSASLLAGRLPQAVLAYRRGLRLAPDDRALQEGLEYARDQVNYPLPGRTGRPAPPSWPVWLPWPAPALLLTLALAAYAAACVAATRWLMTRSRRALLTAGVCIMVGLPFGLGWAWQQWEQISETRTPVVVIAAAKVTLHTGNGPTYPRHETLPELAPGMEARLLFARGDWLQIEFAGGETGWVRKAQALIDQP